MANKSTTIQIRVDAELKRQAAEVLEGMHLTMSQAITLFLVQVVREGRIPAEYFEHGKLTPEKPAVMGHQGAAEDFGGVDDLAKYLSR